MDAPETTPVGGGAERFQGGTAAELRAKAPWYTEAAAGVGSGLICAAFVAPLDVARTRLQVQQRAFRPSVLRDPAVHSRHVKLHPGFTPYTGTFNAISRLYREAGLAGIYRGFSATACVLPLFWGTFFVCYNELKRFYATQFPQLHGSFVHMAAATSAGVVVDVTTNPLWVVRTRLMTQHMYLHAGQRAAYNGILDCFVKMYRHEGIGSYYLGLSATLLGCTHVTIQFPIFEACKAKIAERQGLPAGQSPGTVGILVSSAISKVLASAATYPHEVIRARLQYRAQEFDGFVDCVRRTFRNEGFLAFYNGIGTTFIRTVPACCITFLSYEKIRGLLSC